MSNRIAITVSNGKVVDVASDTDVTVAVFNYDDLVSASSRKFFRKKALAEMSVEFRKVEADPDAIDTAMIVWSDEIDYIEQESD